MLRFTRNRKFTAVLITLVIFLLSSCAFAADAPKNIILLIGDGMGIGPITAARCATPGGKLTLDSMPYTGFSLTQPYGSVVTDSAASATAMATGKKTVNGHLSLDPNNKRLTTILEPAEKNGKSTGLVSTSPIFDATPAAFACHVQDRHQWQDIASQIMSSGVDVILGGGSRYFTPANGSDTGRNDGRDLVAEAAKQNFEVIQSKEQLAKSKSAKMIGFFAPDSMSGRSTEPTYADMTIAAITALNKNDKGFFLMSENGLTDLCGHGNDFPGMIKQVKVLDEGVKKVLDFAAKDGKTLVIVTADHDTGGLAVLDPSSDSDKVGGGWVTKGHSGNMVAIYAFGPGAELFCGTHQNTDIASIFAKLWKVDLR